MTEPDKEPPNVSPKYLSVPRNAMLVLVGGAGAGLLLALLSAATYSGGSRRLLLAYLVAVAFALSLSLGSIFFVLVQHLTRAGWGVLVRRPAEILGLNIVTVAILFLPIAWSVATGSGNLYPWAQPRLTDQPHLTHVVDSSKANDRSVDHHDHRDAELYVHQTVDDLTRSKQGWLNPGWYLCRAGLFFAVWTLIAGYFFFRSRRQDEVDGYEDTRRMESWSGPAAIAFGVTLTFAAFDLLMSLDPHWYSTIFGVYYFAGCAVGGLSSILLSVLLLEHYRIFPAVLSDEHRRDLGRLLFAFIIFWCYIAFSQYMLLWYANVPETTRWLVVRGASLAEGYTNSWGYLLVFLLLGHFFIPFFGIMSRHVKSRRGTMVFWTAWLLIMHYFDLYWIVMPEFGSHFTIGLPELSTLLFVACVYLLGASVIATRTSLVPTGDPRLRPSLAITAAY